MFRTRLIAPLLRSLLLGVAVPFPLGMAAVTAASVTMVGCADENAPETHIKRLEDPRLAPAAVKRLIQFFEDAMTRDKQNREGPTVQPLLGQIVEPLAKMCVDGNLNERTKSQLIKFLSDARDPRAEPCFVHVLTDYKPDTTEEDVRWVARAVAAMKMEAASQPLLNVFKTIKVSRPKASVIYRDLNAAVLDLADKTWEDELIKVLERPIADRKDVATLKNEVFWQVTAAEALGSMKSEKAIKPLIKVILSPVKADIAATAVNALIKIGKPAIAPTVALLNGEDEELVQFAKEENLKVAEKDSSGKIPKQAQEAAEKAHVMTAAIILGSIGHKDAQADMLKTLAETKDDLTRAVIARELPKLPTNDQAKTAFKEAYEKTPVSLSIPPGMGGREALLEAGGTFYDDELTPWMVQTAMDAKGESADVEPVRAASLETAMKIMTKDQIDLVKGLYAVKITGADGKPAELGKGYEKEFKMATELLAACEDKVECYLAKLADPASHEKDKQFQGIKSAYMVGALGGPEVREKLIELMPKLENAAIRFVAVSVIDHHSPEGSTEIADKLQKIVDDAEESRDQNRIQSNAPFKTIIYRLRARAQ
jgi:HEAT repeat protein